MTFLIIKRPFCQEKKNVGVQALGSFDKSEKWRRPPETDSLLCDSGSDNDKLRNSYNAVVNEGIVFHFRGTQNDQCKLGWVV